MRSGNSSVNIPLPPDQHHCSDEAKWRIGGDNGADSVTGEAVSVTDDIDVK